MEKESSVGTKEGDAEQNKKTYCWGGDLFGSLTLVLECFAKILVVRVRVEKYDTQEALYLFPYRHSYAADSKNKMGLVYAKKKHYRGSMNTLFCA